MIHLGVLSSVLVNSSLAASVNFLGQELNNQGSQEYIHIKVLRATVDL